MTTDAAKYHELRYDMERIYHDYAMSRSEPVGPSSYDIPATINIVTVTEREIKALRQLADRMRKILDVQDL